VRSKQQEWVKVAAAERNSGARTDTLDAEINKMQKQVAQLESEIDQLYQQRSSIQLG
jgi:prefoldin subunit 5